jgi:hypothetical protein
MGRGLVLEFGGFVYKWSGNFDNRALVDLCSYTDVVSVLNHFLALVAFIDPGSGQTPPAKRHTEKNTPAIAPRNGTLKSDISRC